MRRVIGLIAAIFVVFSLAGCSTDDYQNPDYSRICVNAQTHERVDGARCGNEYDRTPSIGYLWWFMPYGHVLPAYGYPVTVGRQNVSRSAIVEHDERLSPTGGKSYTKTTTHAYSSGSGKKLPTVKGGTGYKPLPPKVKNAPQVPANKAPQGGYKAPVKAPAPVVRAPAPVVRAPAPVRIR